jgi:hypothetical protein
MEVSRRDEVSHPNSRTVAEIETIFQFSTLTNE